MLKFACLLAALAAATTASPAAHGETCPGPLIDALRLVLVTTPSMNTASATMRLYMRTSATSAWVQEGEAEPAVVGQAGLGWGYGFGAYKRDTEVDKFEGDRRTPAGVFRIGASFGFSPLALPGHVVLKLGQTVCVDDPASTAYNTIASRQSIGANVHGEDMRQFPAYRSGLFVEYPTDRTGQRGSCIFIHVWRAPRVGTTGCVAAPEASVKRLQVFSQPGAVMAVLSEPALGRFGSCLPTRAAARSAK